MTKLTNGEKPNKILSVVYTKSSLYSIDINASIISNDIEGFKKLLESPNESLSEDERYSIAYGVCMEISDKRFLNYLILECNLRENLINPKYITEEAKCLFAERRAKELSQELSSNSNQNKKIKI